MLTDKGSGMLIKERTKALVGPGGGGGRMTEMGEGTQAKGCLKSHYGLLSESSVIITLMALISLQFGA